MLYLFMFLQITTYLIIMDTFSIIKHSMIILCVSYTQRILTWEVHIGILILSPQLMLFLRMFLVSFGLILDEEKRILVFSGNDGTVGRVFTLIGLSQMLF